MSRELPFYIYCIELYRLSKNLSGKEAIVLFEKYDVPNYIYTFFEALHTTGEKYIINDIDSYIKSKKI